MDDIREDLPMSMTMAAFAGVSWYIGLEINISLFLMFKRRTGLYFWSCALVSWGIILQTLFIILADFQIWTNFVGAVTMIYLSWFIMVIPQSWVLYSRLHLVVHNQKLLRYVRWILIFNSVVFSVPTIVIGIIAVSLLSAYSDMFTCLQHMADFGPRSLANYRHQSRPQRQEYHLGPRSAHRLLRAGDGSQLVVHLRDA